MGHPVVPKNSAESSHCVRERVKRYHQFVRALKESDPPSPRAINNLFLMDEFVAPITVVVAGFVLFKTHLVFQKK